MSLPAIDGQTKLIGIFGDPVTHTFSPAMHNAAFEHLGLNYRYVPFHVKPDNIKQAVESIRVLNLVGVNVTIPHKVAVMEYLDDYGPVTEACRAVNTIHYDQDQNKLIGYNTDSKGFIAALKKKGINIETTKFLILGAGGAARAAVSELNMHKANQVFIFNRTSEKARELAEYTQNKFRKATTTKNDVIEYRNKIGDFIKFNNIAVIVNCTSLGLREEDDFPVSPALINAKQTIFDMAYRSEPTRLLVEAEQRGAQTINGLEMLLYQGAEAFKIWTGIWPPVEVMRAALYEKLGIKK